MLWSCVFVCAGGLSAVVLCFSRWMAYSRKHREHPFDWTLLLKLLEDLDEKWEQADLSRDEVGNTLLPMAGINQKCFALEPNNWNQQSVTATVRTVYC